MYVTMVLILSYIVISHKPILLYSDHGVITEWMKDYAKQIQQTRENGGLMSHPVSNELLNAELKLAEVSRKTIINIYGSGRKNQLVGQVPYQYLRASIIEIP